jgi:hypothetical protein
VYPVQVPRGGCGDYQGIAAYNPEEKHADNKVRAGVNCYGIKPPATTSNIIPFNEIFKAWNQPKVEKPLELRAPPENPNLRPFKSKETPVNPDPVNPDPVNPDPVNPVTPTGPSYNGIYRPNILFTNFASEIIVNMKFDNTGSMALIYPELIINLNAFVTNCEDSDVCKQFGHQFLIKTFTYDGKPNLDFYIKPVGQSYQVVIQKIGYYQKVSNLI